MQQVFRKGCRIRNRNMSVVGGGGFLLSEPCRLRRNDGDSEGDDGGDGDGGTDDDGGEEMTGKGRLNSIDCFSG